MTRTKISVQEFMGMASDWSDALAMLKGGSTAEEVVKKHAWAKVYLKTKPDAQTKPKSKNKGTKNAANNRIPKDALDIISKCIGLEEHHVDTIMSLVSLPENGSSKWWDYYNYIEYGSDSSIRGYTTTIFGATSGTGSLLKVFDALANIDSKHPLLKYHAALRTTRGGNIKGLEGLAHVKGDPTKAKANYANYKPNERTHLDHIEGDLARLSQNDEAWKRAVWLAFIELNWSSAANFCAKIGACANRPGPVLTTPLAKGFMVDTSLNHGDCTYWNEASTWKEVWKAMDDPQQPSEKDWLLDFIKARRKVLRSGFQGLDWSKSGDRCLLWRDLVAKNNWEFTRPIALPDSTAKPHPIWPPGLKLQ
jgi:hypothetical protein